jgi:hypothetical protein
MIYDLFKQYGPLKSVEMDYVLLVLCVPPEYFILIKKKI